MPSYFSGVVLATGQQGHGAFVPTMTNLARTKAEPLLIGGTDGTCECSAKVYVEFAQIAARRETTMIILNTVDNIRVRPVLIDTKIILKSSKRFEIFETVAGVRSNRIYCCWSISHYR